MKILFKFILLNFFVLTLSFFLSSCSHVSRKDGPPDFYVDETKIPNAVPKPETLAKYGNMSSYVVFGKRYYTLSSSRHYDEVGTASWYGTLFNTRRTSSGERYSLLGMTAAHKTLPLPTYVEVTNLKNHRKVIVKVNDRGPFESNRLIDLSYVAAKKLGMIGHGTTLVRVKAIDPTNYEVAQPTLFAKNETHRSTAFKHHVHPQAFHDMNQPALYLQVGAFKSRSNAQQLEQRLKHLSLSVKVTTPSFTSKLYRVKIGPIYDQFTAERITHRLNSLGIKSNRIMG